MLIGVEGIDGAGKQTLADALDSAIVAKGRAVARMGFPRYNSEPFGRSVGAALEQRDDRLLSSVEALAFAFAADRWHYWHVDRVGMGHTAATITIADRWCASNAAYGSARLGEDSDGFADWIEDLEFGHCALPRPALSVLLATGSSLAGEQRAGRDGDDGDAFEADGGLQRRALDWYFNLAKVGWGGAWKVIDPLDSNGNRRIPADLADEVLAAVSL
ncbi:MAG: dTMP kinase [Actinomycetia bacterium]|nr:dTMP kinase [Actinomycetes bacterium]MCP4958927.1 dTMP kinase [Actinomycetes bacterium]